MDILSSMIIIAHILLPSFKFSIAINSINVSRSISDGNILVSNDGVFELGFFSPGNSTKRYLGIWYKSNPMRNVVWVANREKPINDSSGTLTVNSTGNLVLSQNDSVVWYTTSQKQAQKPVVELLDSGNLVIRNEGEPNQEHYLWQSFDYPSDTLLPGMKLGWDLRTGFERRLTSWKSPNDPALGDLSWVLKLYNYPEFYIMKGTFKYIRIGPWNGLHFSGLSDRKPNPIYDFKYVANNDDNYESNKDEMFYSFILKNSSFIGSVTISPTNLSIYVWMEDKQSLSPYEIIPRNECDEYGTCGAYGKCTITDYPLCQCLRGFVPKSPEEWSMNDWSGGCVRDKPFNCEDYILHEFVKFVGLVVPDTSVTWMDENIDLVECRLKCLNNCSCTAYANSDIRGKGSGCVIWFGDLVDMKQFQTGGQDLYVRMPASELEPLPQHGHHQRMKRIIAITFAAICGVLLLCIYVIYRVRRNITDKSKTIDNIERQLEDLDLPLFDMLTISIATNSFSLNNKIGQGGFGPVYKGKLLDGQEIAVKRLSRTSGQGMPEFITEVKLITKLQHRNLVKLLGCCILGEEKLLVYEYMVNGSLDSFIFDQIKGKLLDWPRRFHIIFGVARGLLYLHQDSRLRIIHRDLKASNVLLDDMLNPKISDFGMARAFGGDQTEGNTNRVVGTYGYMAPEYAVDGLFSIKSDVFSFGIL